jgi:hypothetical protein
VPFLVHDTTLEQQSIETGCYMVATSMGVRTAHGHAEGKRAIGHGNCEGHGDRPSID